MTQGFKKLLGVCRDESCEWMKWSGMTGSHTTSLKVKGTPLSVAAGADSGDSIILCRELGLTKTETRAAIVAFERLFVEEFDSNNFTLEEYKEFLQLHARLMDALGGFSPKSYQKALASIGARH